MNIEKTKSPAVARSMECGTVIEPGVFRLETRALPEDAPDGWVLVDIEPSAFAAPTTTFWKASTLS